MSESRGKKASTKDNALAMEVEILTKDHEIRGLIYVARDIDESRRISELLNDPDRRFLAITDVQMIARQGASSPRSYKFLQVHIDNIIMLHPSVEASARKMSVSTRSNEKIGAIRAKLNRS